MVLVVGVFDQNTMPTNLDAVMRALPQLDLEGDDVTILGNNAGGINTDQVVIPVVPLAAARSNSGESGNQGAGAALIATGLFDRLDLGDEEREYFRSQAEKEGATVIFVDADSKHANAVVELFRRSNAARAEILR